MVVQHNRDGAPLRVVVGDPRPCVRQGIRVALDADGDIIVVGEAELGQDVVAQVERCAPDVVLVGAHLPDLHGIEVARRITRRRRRVGVIVLGVTDDDDETLFQALAAGAAAVVADHVHPRDLARLIRAVAGGACPINEIVITKGCSMGPVAR